MDKAEVQASQSQRLTANKVAALGDLLHRGAVEQHLGLGGYPGAVDKHEGVIRVDVHRQIEFCCIPRVVNVTMGKNDGLIL